MQCAYIDVAVLHQDAFGDFQFQPLRRDAGLRERVDDCRNQARTAHLGRRQVDRHAQRFIPLGGVFQSLANNPFAELHDQSRFLGDRDEFIGHHNPALGMFPTQKRFEPRLPECFQVDQRLIMQSHFLFGQRCPQIKFEISAFFGDDIHFHFKNGNAIAPRAFG